MKKQNSIFYKSFQLLFILITFMACENAKNEELIKNKFKSKDLKVSTSIMIEDSLGTSVHIINSDSTFSYISEIDHPNFNIGYLLDKSDSTEFIPIDIKNFNFFLHYKIRKSKKNQEKFQLEILDKTGKKINNLEIKLFTKNNSTVEKTKEGKIFIDKEVDSISFPQLNSLSNKNHTIEFTNNPYDIKIYLDINEKVLREKDLRYQYSQDSTFILFTPLKNLIESNQ